MPALTRPQKITFGEMRDAGVHGILIYCADYHCSHWTSVSADPWSDRVRLSDLEPKLVCQACGSRGADVRPDWQSARNSAFSTLRPVCGPYSNTELAP